MRNYFPLPAITAIMISGDDRLKWLNNLVTNDLRKTAQEQAVECFVTDVKGRTLSHGMVFPNQEKLIYFSWGAEQAARLLPHWDRYIIREDVMLSDVSSRWRWGVADRTWLSQQLGNPSLAGLSDRQLMIDNESDSLAALAGGMLGENWLLVRCATNDPFHRILEREAHDIHESDWADLESLRIRHRWPLIGIDFDDKNLPQELDRNAVAISFTKGCYLGQETVARLDALGQVQKKLVLLSFEADERLSSSSIQHGAVVQKEEQEAGTITSFSGSGAEGYIALAYLRRAFFRRVPR